MNQGRLHNSMLNLITGFAYRILCMLTGFVVRTIFIQCLAKEYLGVNGLYSSILSMLSLAELGFGNAIVFSMYKPLAERDYQKLRQLVDFYKKAYILIGTVILAIGLGLLPFLGVFIKDARVTDNLDRYYILFLMNTVASYWFFAYRTSILTADQKGYVISNYNSIFNLIKSALQIVLLLLFKSFTVYLLTQMICTIAMNIALALRVKKSYPIFGVGAIERLPKEETRRILKDVKALTLSKISHVVLNSTDNIIISTFVGLNEVGLLSNFNMVVEAVTGILCQITGAITASLGSFFATEDKEAGYILFKRVEFINFWLYGFSAVALVVLLKPFTYLWLGDQFLMSTSVIVAIAINFFVAGFMNTLWTFRSTLGLFTQGQYRPLIVAIINIVLSISLSFIWGTFGVLVATTMSRACVNLWYDPLMLHHYGFGKSVKQFYLGYLKKSLVIVAVALVLWWIAKTIVFVHGITYGSFTVLMLITILLPNTVLVTVFYKTDEYKYAVSLLKRLVSRA